MNVSIPATQTSETTHPTHCISHIKLFGGTLVALQGAQDVVLNDEKTHLPDPASDTDKIAVKRETTT